MSEPKAKPDAIAVRGGGWRGDEHRLRLAAAAEVGLARADVEVDLYAEGFKAGITAYDPYDGAIVARGRTILRDRQLLESLRPTLRHLGVGRDAASVRVHDGDFELRVAKHAAEASSPVLEAGKLALQTFVAAGLLGMTAYLWGSPAAAAVIWGLGLTFGGLRVRRGLEHGRAMLSDRLALALGVLAREQQLILPPAGDREA